MGTVTILSFYSFTNLANLEILLSKILYIGKKKFVKGTIILAPEGFNGTIAGSEQNVEIILNEIIKLTNPKDVNIKRNYATNIPFSKLKIKLKPEIIAIGIKDLEVAELKGEYIDPKDWDRFILQDDVIVIDTRNDYEIKHGTFKNAVNPNTITFKQLPTWIEQNKNLLNGKKIAMYCTGGIRCEKSTAYLKMQGYKEIYHLKGGILQYLHDTKNSLNLWQGKCFVFDDRRAVDEELLPTTLNPMV